MKHFQRTQTSVWPSWLDRQEGLILHYEPNIQAVGWVLNVYPARLPDTVYSFEPCVQLLLVGFDWRC